MPMKCIEIHAGIKKEECTAFAGLTLIDGVLDAGLLNLCEGQPWLAFNKELASSLQEIVTAAWDRVYIADAPPTEKYSLNTHLAQETQEVMLTPLHYVSGSHRICWLGMGGAYEFSQFLQAVADSLQAFALAISVLIWDSVLPPPYDTLVWFASECLPASDLVLRRCRQGQMQEYCNWACNAIPGLYGRL